MFTDDYPGIKQTMYEVRCVKQTGIESYAWINVNSNFPPISRFQPPLFCSCSNCIVLYDPGTKLLWKFENETWTNVSTIPDHLQPFQDVLSKSFGCAFAKETRSYLVFNIRDKTVLNFDLNRNTYSTETVGGNLPHRWYKKIVSTVVETQYKIIVFITDIRLDKTTAWTLTYGNRVWIWTIWPAPDIAPSARFDSTYAFRSHVLTVCGGYDEYSVSNEAYYQESLSGVVWNLDLTTMRWWLKIKGDISDFVDYYGSCWITNSCLVALRPNEKQGMEAWIYNTSDNSWKSLISTSLMKRRSFMSFVTVNATTAISFGGKDLVSQMLFNETWMLHFLPSVHWKRSLGDIQLIPFDLAHALNTQQS